MKIAITTNKSEDELEAARSSALSILRSHGKAEVTIDGEAVTLESLRAALKEGKDAVRMIKEGQRRLAKAKGGKPGDVTVEVPPGELVATGN